MRRIALVAFVVALAFAASGCGNRVKPIDLHDPLVPLDSRRLIADAQDAIAIARARRDEAADQLRRTREWREEITDERRWGEKTPKTALDKLEEYADARIELAELEHEDADTGVELAEAKYTLVTAETAMRHDLAVYELEPLEKRTEALRAERRELGAEIADQRVSVEEISREWWKTYAEVMDSTGAPPAMYVIYGDEDES